MFVVYLYGRPTKVLNKRQPTYSTSNKGIKCDIH